MVRQAARLARLLAGAFRRDLAGLCAVLPSWHPRPGLYRYELRPGGGRRVVHLRVEADQTAVLLIDASDVIHLNPTAAAFTKAALDGMPIEAAIARLRSRRIAAKLPTVERDAGMVYRMVEHLAEGVQACPTCSLEELQRVPLFSCPVAAPLKADLALTYGCNNACHHCYNDPGRKSGRVMPTEAWSRVLEKLRMVGIPHVIFTGGEPTLFNGLSKLIRRANELGMVTGMNTNGRLLAHGTLASDLQRAGLAHVQVTLESHRAELHNAMTATRAFEETIRGIDRCLAAGLQPLTNTTLTRKNAAAARDTLTFLHARGVRCCAFNAMIHAGRGRAHADTLAPEELAPLLAGLRDQAAGLGLRILWYTPTRYCAFSPLELELGARRCNAAEYSICIEPDGDVLPCQSYYRSAGNLLRDPWEAIWQSDMFRRLRGRADAPEACGLPEACWNCPDLSVCGGGCLLEMENGSGGLDLPGEKP